MAILRLLRPHQWVKSSFCLAGLVFSFKFFNLQYVLDALLVAVLFSLASSCVYVLNDYVDIEADRLHPKKRFRPLASGEVSKPVGLTVWFVCLVATIALSMVVGWRVTGCVLFYVLSNVVYSCWAKHIPILDVMFIANGFVLRLLAGIYGVGSEPTAWIILCTFFLALYLGFVKRYSEVLKIESCNEGTLKQRAALRGYTCQFVVQMMNSSLSATVIFYSLYTVLSAQTQTLLITVPIVYYALNHYKFKTMTTSSGEEPEKDFVKDPVLLGCAAVWIILYILVALYSPSLA